MEIGRNLLHFIEKHFETLTGMKNYGRSFQLVQVGR